jgi:hypothetical protein
MVPCSLVLGCWLAGAGDGGVPLKEVGISLPKTAAGLSYKGRQTYEPEGLGYSVAYGNRLCLVTLYVYNRGKKDIPNGKGSDLVAAELKGALEELKGAEKAGVIRNVKQPKGDATLPEAARATFATASFTFDVEDGGCKGSILVVGRSNHFLKIRVSQYVVGGKTNDREVHRFLEALAKRVK